MIKVITAIFVSAQFALAVEGNALVWTTKLDSLTISREAVSIPSVHILDDVIVHCHINHKKIGSFEITKNELKDLGKVGDLDPELEPFFDKCNIFIVEVSENEFYLIYDEIISDRYGYAKAVKRGNLFFQRGALEMCSSKKIPKELISIISKNKK